MSIIDRKAFCWDIIGIVNIDELGGRTLKEVVQLFKDKGAELKGKTSKYENDFKYVLGDWMIMYDDDNKTLYICKRSYDKGIEKEYGGPTFTSFMDVTVSRIPGVGGLFTSVLHQDKLNEFKEFMNI